MVRLDRLRVVFCRGNSVSDDDLLFVIQLDPKASLFKRRFAARTDIISSLLVGFIIALVIPAAIAIGKNVALIVCLFGNPKEMFEAPQVVFTPSSCLKRRMS